MGPTGCTEARHGLHSNRTYIRRPVWLVFKTSIHHPQYTLPSSTPSTMAKSAAAVNVYSSQSDFGHSDAAVEDKIIMYSATLYEYTREYVLPRFISRSPSARMATTRSLTSFTSFRLWMQARKQAERDAAARASLHKHSSPAGKAISHQA